MNNFAPRIRSRKLWDKHGSWLILVIVVGLAFNGGAEWREYKHRAVIATIVNAGVAERDDLRARLRKSNDEKQVLIERFGPASADSKVAAEKATEAVDKVNQLIQKSDNK